MVDATISRARLRDLAYLGRSGLRPRQAQLTPRAGELMASPI
jgi:hypothetical protein